MSQTTRKIVRDEKGAIMIMGLMMMLTLVGLLWYLLGLGATVTFRDHMQDAADSAAFSDAAISANGMNQLTVLNLEITGLVCIYLALSFAVTALWLLTIVACVTVIACAPAARAYHTAYGARGYFALAIRAAEYFVVDEELVIGTTTPALASAGATDVASAYGTHDSVVTGYAYGADNEVSALGEGGEIDKLGDSLDAAGGALDVPGRLLESVKGKEKLSLKTLIGSKSDNINNLAGGLVTGLGEAFLDSLAPPTKVRLGLPVEFERVGNVCSHLINYAAGELENLLGNAAKILKYIAPAGTLFTTKVDESETFFQYYYCDDSAFGGEGTVSTIVKDAFHLLGATEREIVGGGDEAGYWNQAGPTRMWKHSDTGEDGTHHANEPKNGDDYLQFYGFATAPTYYDNDAVHKINLAAFNFKGAGDSPKPATYFAQAEMYFDCDDVWASDACDDEADDDTVDMAMYQQRWQARLVRFHAPSDKGVASTVGGALDNASAGSSTEDAKNQIGDGNSPPARSYH